MEKKQSNRSTEVLAILQQTGEDFVSGEQLCQKLGVSRTAVWKIIKKLKEDGYDIEGVSNRGYRLKEEPEILSREAILTRFHGSWSCAQVECYPVIGSTNDRAKEAYVEGAPHGTLVVADCQKAGKGRRGRQWETPAGAAIAMSSLLRPQLPPEKASMLTLVMALALAQGVSTVTGLEVKIKWPNDLVVNGKKLSGILTEMSADMDEIHYVVIGTGVNVNLEEFPEEIRETLAPFAQKRFRRGMPGGGNLGGVWLALYREDGSWITNLQLDVTARCKRARDNYHPAGDTEDLEAFYQALCARLEAAE